MKNLLSTIFFIIIQYIEYLTIFFLNLEKEKQMFFAFPFSVIILFITFKCLFFIVLVCYRVHDSVACKIKQQGLNLERKAIFLKVLFDNLYLYFKNVIIFLLFLKISINTSIGQTNCFIFIIYTS